MPAAATQMHPPQLQLGNSHKTGFNFCIQNTKKFITVFHYSPKEFSEIYSRIAAGTSRSKNVGKNFVQNLIADVVHLGGRKLDEDTLVTPPGNS